MSSRSRRGPIVASCCGLLALLAAPARAEDDGEARLVESSEAGRRTRVVASLEADGRYLPGEGTDERPVEPIELTVRTRLEYVERVLDLDDEGRPRRVTRRVEAGEVAIGGPEPIRASSTTLRRDVSLLVADRGRDGKVVVASLSGPLTRPELDLVQQPLDPLDLPALLPGGPVALGDRWPLPESAAKAISGYDALASNDLEAALRRLDGDSAEVEIRGRVEGAVLGGRGRMDVEGTLHFDREAGRIALLTLRRAERREAGPVEAGLEFRSTIRVERSDAPADPDEPAPPRVPDRPPDDWLLLSYESPDGRYRLEHDRSWHVFSEDDRQAVLRRFDGGSVVAQADFVAGPTVEPGAHPKPERFRSDVREALGDRFDRVIDAGRVSAPPGEYRYRLAIGGKQGIEPIVWYYYLVSDDSGRQLVAIFTVRGSEVERVGRLDQRMIGSLRWQAASAASPADGR